VFAPGTMIAGKYRIERRLARGGQATVYLASQLPLNRPVALKILAPPGADLTDEERIAFEQRFLLEARTLAALDHPNIVTVFDYGETGEGRFYLAMEYIDGQRFLDLLRTGRLDPGRAVDLTMQVCKALRYAHMRGVVHRDVKNSNVLVRIDDAGKEQVKVVDFGLVKLSRVDTGITQSGMILGSPHFMAPEQATGSEVDHRTDIYATGVLLFCGLVGKYPFDGPHATAIITAHMTRAAPRFKDACPDADFPEGLEEIVQRCMEKDADKRYPSMEALIADLSFFHLEGSGEGISGEYYTLTAHPAANRWDWTVVVAGMAVGGIVVVLLALLATSAFFAIQTEDQAAEPAVTSPATSAGKETPKQAPQRAAGKKSPRAKAASDRRRRAREKPKRLQRADKPARSTSSTAPAPRKTETRSAPAPKESQSNSTDLRDPWKK